MLKQLILLREVGDQEPEQGGLRWPGAWLAETAVNPHAEITFAY